MTTIEDGTKSYWTDLRTFSSTAASSSVPPASGFIALDWSGQLPEEVEIRFNPVTTTGSPSEVIYSIWRYLGGKVDKISNITVVSADFNAPIRSCDVIFPSIMSPNLDTIYSRGKVFEVKF